jgi:hypothetical protein
LVALGAAPSVSATPSNVASANAPLTCSALAVIDAIPGSAHAGVVGTVSTVVPSAYSRVRRRTVAPASADRSASIDEDQRERSLETQWLATSVDAEAPRERHGDRRPAVVAIRAARDYRAHVVRAGDQREVLIDVVLDRVVAVSVLLAVALDLDLRAAQRRRASEDRHTHRQRSRRDIHDKVAAQRVEHDTLGDAIATEPRAVCGQRALASHPAKHRALVVGQGKERRAARGVQRDARAQLSTL